MKRGILENITTIICFTALIAYTQNYLLFLPMMALILWFTVTGVASFEDAEE